VENRSVAALNKFKFEKEVKRAIFTLQSNLNCGISAKIIWETLVKTGLKPS